jgi:hypothetical protein
MKARAPRLGLPSNSKMTLSFLVFHNSFIVKIQAVLGPEQLQNGLYQLPHGHVHETSFLIIIFIILSHPDPNHRLDHLDKIQSVLLSSAELVMKQTTLHLPRNDLSTCRE